MTVTKTTLEFVFICLVFFGGAALSFLIPDFNAGGGANTYNLVFTAVCAFAFLYLTIRDGAEQKKVFFPSFLIIVIGLFSIVLLITNFTGWYLHASLIDSFELLLAFALFFGTAGWVTRSETGAENLIGCIVVGSAVLSLYGFYTFINGDLGYLHLTSLFDEHNAFGGFLLIPLCASVGLSLMSSLSNRMRFIYSCCAILIGAALILTFSRGTFIALFISVILGAVFFWKQFTHVSRATALRAVALIILTLLLAGGWYTFAKDLGKIESSSVSIYGGNPIPGDPTYDRVAYLQESARILANWPLGIGAGNYALGAQVYRTSVLRFAFDPHNYYAKVFVETGVIGGLLFVISLLYVFFRPAYSAYAGSRAGKSQGLLLALLVGCGAALIHAGMDVDETYPLVVFTLLISLGVIWGMSPSLLSKHSRISSLPIEKIAAVTAGIVTIFFLFEFVSTYYSLEANYSISNKQYTAALSMEKLSAELDPTNAGTYVSEGEIYYTMSSNFQGAQRLAYTNDALAAIKKAIQLNPHSSIAYIDESFTYQNEGDLHDALAAVQHAVAVDPLNNLDDHVHLAQLYLFNRENQNVIVLVNKTTADFPPSLFTDATWTDPSKEQWRDDLVQLCAMEAAAYKVEGNTAGSNLTTTLEAQYAGLKL